MRVVKSAIAMSRIINKAIIHYSASDDVSAKTIDEWHKKRGMKMVGYHRVIRRDGTIENGRPEELVGAHTKNHNQDSLGVCLTGSNDMPWYPTGVQYQSLQSILRHWMAKYRFSQIYFHRDLGQTACPGRLDKEQVLRMVGGGEDELDEKARADIAQIYKHFDETVDPQIKIVKDILVPRSENTLEAIQGLTEAINKLRELVSPSEVDIQAITRRVEENIRKSLAKDLSD